jgi:1-deoxy-D-xylulose-5-phosphate reductoisomerase
MKRIVVLGATGSIGRAALEVIERFPDRFQVVGLSSQANVTGLAELVHKFHAEEAVIASEVQAQSVQELFPSFCRLSFGEMALSQLAAREDVDLVLVSVVGIAGLLPTLQALRKGKTVALATKEALVAGGKLVRRALSEGKGLLLPVDSEHSAIFQCLQGNSPESLEKIILTASGGPFYGKSQEALEKVTVDEALAHPVWRMGKKVTIDSATLMNKGLEVIEAHYLFDLPPERIEVLIHPRSIVHSLVQFRDGAMLAQLSLPDMRLPIQFALLFPERLPSLVQPLDLSQVKRLDFEKADPERFPALKLAYQVLSSGGTFPTVLSAADEIAVQAFLEGRITFPRIVEVVEEVLSRHSPYPGNTLQEALEADRWARKEAEKIISGKKSPDL